MSKRKVTAPDFTLSAAGVFLSSWPKSFKTGQQILRSLETKCTSEVEPWQPFESYDGTSLSEEIQNVAVLFERMWEIGFRQGARVFPTQSARRNYNRSVLINRKGD